MDRTRLLVSAVPVAALSGCSTAEVPEARTEAPVTRTEVPVTRIPEAPNGAELQSSWWTWASSAEAGQSPVEDTTGEHCAANQPAGVWLVAGTYDGKVTRQCAVPSGLPLAGPAVNFVAPTASECATSLEQATGEAILDGSPLSLSRIEPVTISITTAEGPSTGYACGLWARIAPLSPGVHSLTLRGSSATFETEAQYGLSVTAAP